MTEIKGMILEIENSSAIILTPDGEFKKIPIKDKNLDVGMEVYYKESPKKNYIRKLSFIAVAALFALILFNPLSFIQPASYQVAAYVTLDINPSIELGVSDKNDILSAEALNDDGVSLLGKMNLVGLKIDNALELITDEAIKQEYLSSFKEENAIIISVIDTGEVENIIKPKELEQKVQEFIKDKNFKIVTESLNISPEVRVSAKDNGLSPAKYLMLLEAWDEGISINLEDIKNQPIITAIKNAGGNPGQIISKVKVEEAFEKKENKYLDKLNKKDKIPPGLEKENNQDIQKKSDEVLDWNNKNNGNNDKRKDEKNKINIQPNNRNEVGLKLKSNENVLDDSGKEHGTIKEKNGEKDPEKQYGNSSKKQ